MREGTLRRSNLRLPPLIMLRDFETLDDWLDYLHWQYLAIVQDAGLQVLGKPIQRAGGVRGDGRDARFWHLITDGIAGGGPRRLDPGRAAHLGQAWHVLELLAAGDIRAVWWREGYRVYVSTVDFRLLVVLHESAQHFALVTVHPIRRRRRGALPGPSLGVVGVGRLRSPGSRAAFGSGAVPRGRRGGAGQVLAVSGEAGRMVAMDARHARRLLNHLTVDETEAIPALEQGRLVYALSRDGWSEVKSIEPLTRHGDSEPSAFTVVFAQEGVHSRIFRHGGTFWVERQRKAWEAPGA